MKTSSPCGDNEEAILLPRDDLEAAVLEQEHVMTTHMAVIEGWLELLEDDSLDAAQRQRAATVMRERTTALRLDLCALLRAIRRGVCAG